MTIFVVWGNVRCELKSGKTFHCGQDTFVPDFNLLKIDSLDNISYVETTETTLMIAFDHHTLKQMRKGNPLLSLAFQLHMCKYNFGKFMNQMGSVNPVAEGKVTKELKHKGSDRQMTRAEQLKMESVLAKKREEYEKEQERKKLQNKMKKKNARMAKTRQKRNRRQTLCAVAKDSVTKTAAELPKLGDSLSELEIQKAFNLLQQYQLSSKFFRGFSENDLMELSKIMKVEHFKNGEFVVRQGDRSTSVILMLYGGGAEVGVSPDQGGHRNCGI